MRYGLFIAALLVATPAMAQINYFPAGSFSPNQKSDEFRVQWYSGHLRALEEPSLWESSKTQKTQFYRFLWLRTFHHPIVIRIDVNGDGTALLTKKMTSGQGGYGPGVVLESNTMTMTNEETSKFLGKIEEHQFWKLPSTEKDMGCDGAQWVIEGIKDGAYHIVDRWSPRKGDVRAIGLMMKDLAKLKIDAREVY